jgi:hypothetical protein
MALNNSRVLKEKKQQEEEEEEEEEGNIKCVEWIIILHL